ncbi:MAG TPA: hypothetical protein VLY20_02080 [Nitrospiria bacterium]|nr:hypothetical protein [Nitrospiria bacterium]
MKSFFKFISFLFLLIVAFGAGYLTGSFKAEKLNRLLTAAKSEMSMKVVGLEGEVRSLRFRMQLTTARDRMLSAENNIKERNFGTAEKELTSAKEELHTALPMASKEVGEALTGLESSLGGVIETVHRSDPRANTKLKEVKTGLDRLINRS